MYERVRKSVLNININCFKLLISLMLLFINEAINVKLLRVKEEINKIE